MKVWRAAVATMAIRIMVIPAGAQAHYAITDIGVIPGGYFSDAYGINDYGVVVGSGGLSTFYREAFTWTKAGGMVELGNLPGGVQSDGYAINNRGEVAGAASTPRSYRAFFWSSGGGMQDLGVLPDGINSFGYGININGHVTGISGQSDGDHPFLYIAGNGMQDLGSAGPASTNANAVNDSDQVVGEAGHAFLWTPGVGMEDLGVLSGGNFSTATAINNAGQVVGKSENGFGGEAILWTRGGGMRGLGTLAHTGDDNSEALGINAFGTVVGDSTATGVNGTHAFVWTEGTGMLDMNDTIDSTTPGWVLSTARGINAGGEIVGSGLFNGAHHAFLATPVPEPASFLALGGALLLASRRRRP